MVLLTLVLVGTYAIKGPFWALATDWLSAGTAAAGIAAINTLSHLGTSGATWLLGYIKGATGSFSLSLIPLAVLTGLGACIVLWMGRSQKRDAEAMVDEIAKEEAVQAAV